jgi:hypothetical protein
MSASAHQALARTVQLIAEDIFCHGPGEDPGLEAAIVEGLQTTTVRLCVDQANLQSPAGQTALVTLFGLLAMMGIGIDLDIPEIAIAGQQPPLRGDELRAALLAYGGDLIPGARVGSGMAEPDLTFVFGDTPARYGAVFRITGGPWSCQLGRPDIVAPIPWRGSWPFGAVAGAAAAAAEGLRAALPRISAITGQRLPADSSYRLDPDRGVTLDLTVPDLPAQPFAISADFISAGAITTAAAYCLARIPGAGGQLRMIDPDRFDLPNLNRYPLARRSDCGRFKTDILSDLSTEQLHIRGERDRFDGSSAGSIGPLHERVLVGVDDIPSRWAVQRAADGWIAVAGTSHFFALVSSHSPGNPCGGCAHPRDEDLAGPIPTISFVSFWAGLIQARALLVEAAGIHPYRAATYISPLGLYGPRGLQAVGVAARADCPVGCPASKARPTMITEGDS